MMSPGGFERGRIAVRVARLLANFAEERRLGVVTGAETGFFIAREPDTVRAPDVAFLRAERVPVEPERGFFPGAPDLAVEVLSPSDRASEVLAKVQDWLGAGTRIVWVVDPATHTVTVYRAPNQAEVLAHSDTLTGDDLLPDFQLPVAEIFAR
jgi:Uma2 family endonuclease